MINSNQIVHNQSFDSIKRADAHLPSTNCSNNSTILSSVESAGQNSFLSNILINNEKQSATPVGSITPQYPLSPSNLRQIALSPISIDRLTARSDALKADNELLSQLTSDELIFRIKSLETKNRKLLYENGNLVKDLNSSLATNQYLKKDNSELRDLCCYLDDDRQKSRQIAFEWNNSFMILKKEITNYSQKLDQLENKQFELVRENYELKQLCLLLDKASIDKNTEIGQLDSKTSENCKQNVTDDAKKLKRSFLNSKFLDYVKLLEMKLKELEESLKVILSKSDKEKLDKQYIEELRKLESVLNLDNIRQQRPNELENAMKVLEIEKSIEEPIDKNQLEQENDDTNQINEDQKLVIKTLCSAAYSKIEEDD